MKSRSVIVTGPTATGKTSIGTALARHFDGEIISADSRQVYRGLDAGTGKDLCEYGRGDDAVPYHLIDVRDPMGDYSLFDFRRDYCGAFSAIREKGHLPILCGGTPLYVDMVLKDYQFEGGGRDSDLHRKLFQFDLELLVKMLSEEAPERLDATDLTQKARVIRAIEIARGDEAEEIPLPDAEYLVLAPYFHRKEVHERVRLRLEQRWSEMLAESETLLASGVTHERFEQLGLEYRYMSRLILGDLTDSEAFEQLLIRIRKFVKRQDIWFRKMENEGAVIHWIDGPDRVSQAVELTSAFLAGEDLPEPEIRISQIRY